MTALAQNRMTDFAGTVPSRGTYPIKANVRIFKGGLVGLDVAGRAMPADTIANGCLQIVGKASAEYDNRTGSLLGGAAAACDVEVEFGTYAWANSADADLITVANIGDLAFAVDDQTVALTSNSGARVAVGVITEVIGGIPWVWSGPIVPAFEDAEAQNLAIAALQADVVSTSNAVEVNFLAGACLANGTPMAAFADDAAASSPGVTVVDSKSLGIRWNNAAAHTAVFTKFVMPADIDIAANATLEFLVSKTGATVGDATKMTVQLFNQVATALHDADADFGGDTGALVGNATAKTITKLSLTLALANLAAPGSAVTMTYKPKDGTAGTDDIVLHGVRLVYKGKALT